VTDDFLADARADHGYISDDEMRRAEIAYGAALLAWAETEMEQ
jgi:hypothetical protein